MYITIGEMLRRVANRGLTIAHSACCTRRAPNRWVMSWLCGLRNEYTSLIVEQTSDWKTEAVGRSCAVQEEQTRGPKSFTHTGPWDRGDFDTAQSVLSRRLIKCLFDDQRKPASCRVNGLPSRWRGGHGEIIVCGAKQHRHGLQFEPRPGDLQKSPNTRPEKK